MILSALQRQVKGAAAMSRIPAFLPQVRFAGIDCSGAALDMAKDALLGSCEGLAPSNISLVCKEYTEGGHTAPPCFRKGADGQSQRPVGGGRPPTEPLHLPFHLAAPGGAPHACVAVLAGTRAARDSQANDISAFFEKRSGHHRLPHIDRALRRADAWFRTTGIWVAWRSSSGLSQPTKSGVIQLI